MNKIFLFFDQSGSILQYMKIPEQHVVHQAVPAGGGYQELAEMPADILAHQSSNYVSGGQIVPRSPMALTASKASFSANGTDEVTITGVPVGAVARIFGAVTAGPETIADGEIIITSNKPGKIRVLVTKVPEMKDWSITLDAV